MNRVTKYLLFILTAAILLSSCSVGKIYVIQDLLPEFNDPVTGNAVIDKIKVTRLNDSVTKELSFSEAESFQLSYSSVKCYKKKKPSDIAWDYKVEYFDTDEKSVLEILINKSYNFLIDNSFYEAQDPAMGADIYYIENTFKS